MTLQDRINHIGKQLEYLKDKYNSDVTKFQQIKDNLLFSELPKLMELLGDSVSTLNYIQTDPVDDDAYSLDYYQSYGRQQKIIENYRKQAKDCLERLNK